MEAGGKNITVKSQTSDIRIWSCRNKLCRLDVPNVSMQSLLFFILNRCPIDCLVDTSKKRILVLKLYFILN